MRTSCWVVRLVCLTLALGSAPFASALIEIGRGNAPVHDYNWPAGSVDVANLKSRVGWWEGPPLGGGQHCFQYRGDTQTFQHALDLFAQIKAPELDVVVHEGPNSSDFLKDAKDPKSDTSVDWTLTLWSPEGWYQFYDSSTRFAADQPEFRGDVAPPQLDVYVSEGRIDWSRVQVPAGIHVTDERATANGYTVADGSVIRGEAYDMSTSKPIRAIEVMVSKYKGQKDGQNEWEKVAGTVGDADGCFEIKQVPAGSYYIVARCVGYAPRTLGYVGLGKNTLKIYKTQLSAEVQVSGTVTDPAGKPLAGVKVRADGIMAFNGRSYACADNPETVTDADGHFTLAGMPRGHARFWAHADKMQQVEVLKVYESPADNIKITMAATGAIRGKVLDRAGNPAANGNASVWPEGGLKVGTWGGNSNVKDDGSFSFENVPPGKYFISADAGAQNRKDHHATLYEVKAGETLEVELTKP